MGSKDTSKIISNVLYFKYKTETIIKKKLLNATILDIFIMNFVYLFSSNPKFLKFSKILLLLKLKLILKMLSL